MTHPLNTPPVPLRALPEQRAGRTFVFDFETKPGFFWYDDATTNFVLAFSGKFLDEEQMHTHLLVPEHIVPFLAGHGIPSLDRRSGLALFTSLYNQADAIVTHNGKRFDIPVVNGALDRVGLPPLRKKPHIDTLTQRVGTKGVPRSLESLADRYGIGEQKMRVPLSVWERAADYEPDALKIVLDRAGSDVRITADLLRETQRRGFLK